MLTGVEGAGCCIPANLRCPGCPAVRSRLASLLQGRRLAACQQRGEQDRHDPRAAQAQSTTRQNTAFR